MRDDERKYGTSETCGVAERIEHRPYTKEELERKERLQSIPTETFSYGKDGRLKGHSVSYSDLPISYDESKEDIGTSMCFVLKCDERIVIVTDSRSARKFSYIDGFRKSIYLDDAKLAFVFSGQNTFDGTRITDFVSRMERDFIGETPKEAIVTFAERIRKWIDPGSVVNVCCAKFDVTPDVWYADVKKNELTVATEASVLWHNGSVALRKLYVDGNGGLIIPDLRKFSEKQAVNFLTHLLRTEIEYRLFVDERMTIGGDVQIMTIERGGKVERYLRSPIST